jgi:hypothetical protein
MFERWIGEEIYGFDSVGPTMGPFPLEDKFGMKVACVLLARSLDPGKNERYIQFSTARKIRCAFSNAYHASRMLMEATVMAYETSKTYATRCPTYGYWFERFILGRHKRMGGIVNSDYALSKEIYLELIDQLEADWEDTQSNEERDDVVEFSHLLNSGFLCGLRGEEIVKLDISGFLKYINIGEKDPKYPHMVNPLIGRLKGETGERFHPIIMAWVTASGVMAGSWAD